MSEQLLQAFIRLFAILASVDGITEDEKQTIRAFLLDRLNEDSALKYYNLFIELTDEYKTSYKGIDEGLKKKSELDEIARLGNQINHELTQYQKIILILDVVTLTIADGTISESEEDIVKKLGEVIRIEQSDIDDFKHFAYANEASDFDNEQYLVIGPEGQNTSQHVGHIHMNNLDGFIAIMELKNHPGTYFLKYIGRSIIFLNNIPLKKGSMRLIPPGSTLRGSNISTVYYSDIVGSFRKYESEEKISFIAENIEFRFKNGALGLRGINIREESGTLIGIMGSSGSGKSTLLNVLNGLESPTLGSVRINGIDIHNDRKNAEGIIGYVPQDDLLMEELTVYQNLYYAARLCFNNMDEEGIDKLVNKTLSNLGLSETCDLKVGSPLDKTISGGQRKRLNIGLELLREPMVMFVDEPTSGLSSRDSENIMDLLKELSLKGKLVFVVIHQPSSDIFKLFDKLVILDVGGYQIYYGNPVEAVVYFKDAFNLVDSEHGACISCGNVNPEQIFNIIETRVVNEFGQLTKERKVNPTQWNDIFTKKIEIKSISDQASKLKSTLHIPGRFVQLKIFAIRDLLSKLSNQQYLLINLLEAPVLAFILAYIVRYFPILDQAEGSSYSFGMNVNIPAYVFMSVIVALFMGLTVSAEEIIRDRKILKRESFLNLSRSSYLYSKILILFGLSAIQTITYTIIGNYILEIDGMFLSFWLILFTTSCFANVLGLNISSAFNSAVTIYIIIPILLIPQLLLSGVVVKFDELNPNISAKDKVPFIGEMMASRWAFEAAMVNQYKENQFEKHFFELDKEIANAEFKILYTIPALNTRLEYCYYHLEDKDPEVQRKFDQSMLTLKNEIGIELDKFGHKNLPEYDLLTKDSFNEDIFTKTADFLDVLKKVYVNRQNAALKKKESIIEGLTDTPQKRQQYEALRKANQNERIEDMVKNNNIAVRIIENDNHLVQKLYPIFYEPSEQEGLFNFRTLFFAPSKFFAGRQIDTLWFNIGVIWVMSIVLVIALYFDVLRAMIAWLGNIRLAKRRISS